MHSFRLSEAALSVLAARVVEVALDAKMSLDQCPATNVFVEGVHQVRGVVGRKVGMFRFALRRLGRTLIVYGTNFVAERDATERDIRAGAFAEQCLRALEERGWSFMYW